MKGNGTSQLVRAIRKISVSGVTISTGAVLTVDPLSVKIVGASLVLDAADVVLPRHVTPANGDHLLLLVAADGQKYYALGVV